MLFRSATREQAALRAQIERDAAAQEAKLQHVGKDAAARSEAARLIHSEELDWKAKLNQIEVLLIEAQSRATVAERQAIQPRLVEALTALGDKALLGEVAQNMNLVSLFRGKEAGAILSEVLGGTRFLPALREALGFGPDGQKSEG